MHPILFQIGSWPVYSYGVLLALAYLAGLQLAVVRARRVGVDGARIMDLGIYLIIAALIGAKLMLIVVEWDYFRAQPRELLSLARTGGVFYGGFLAAFATAAWLVRRYKLKLWSTADLMAPGIALGHVIGRFGCLLAGCCYGRPTSMPWGITFHDPNAALVVGTPLDQALQPTQLFDAGAELLILFILLSTERKGKPFSGRTFWLYTLLYGISRFIIEFYRGDPRGMLWGWSTSQLVSMVLVPLSVFMLWRLSGRATPATQPQVARA
jgi:phosphatidylglycerol---prolipoprotein diacylglyceryl transferase